TPIAGILLTNGELDQCLGLFSLRESQPLHLYATDRVHEGFVNGNSIYRTLTRTPNQITWHTLKLHIAQPWLLPDGKPSGLVITPIPVPGKVPLHLQGLLTPDEEDTIALLIRSEASGRVLTYVPCTAGPTSTLMQAIEAADCLFFDGTFWSDDELIALGLGQRSAREMGHWPLEGNEGSLCLLSAMPPERKIVIHINNTNPILDEMSPERRLVEAANIDVAYDGMEVMI
ncbi:MAG TPA: MBL fold metallo-hydrolase, partial [Nitrospiraceae bacterium]|nr:MBL fold metallo-hydrolase [Nitrospiraceae bacterium]